MTKARSNADMTALASQARTILASGRCALLTLPCDHVRGWVGLIDDGGEPLLLVGADSPPARSADSGRRARVDVPGHNGERVVLAGVLRPVPGTADQLVRRLGDMGRSIVVTSGTTDDLRVLAVSVDEVLICLPGGPGREAGTEAVVDAAVVDRSAFPRRARVTRRTAATRRDDAGRLTRGWSALGPARRVDLTSYALAEPDLVTAYAPDLIEHLNSEHADQMRQVSTRGTATAPPCPPGEVIGATVTSLDRTGLDMWRIGPEGADEVRVTFRSPLAEPRSLGQELRRLLDEAERGSE